MGIEEKYKIIIQSICEVKSIEKDELINILKDNNCKYLLFLMMKKYKCNHKGFVKRNLKIDNMKVINSNLRKAKEKFLINKNFRDEYFQVIDVVEDNIEKNGRKIS